MALYDNRVFRVGEEWWAAEIHSGFGAGSSTPPRIEREGVIFTCLSDSERLSRTAVIPVGFLHIISHRSLVRVLEGATDMVTRFGISPVNSPDPEALRGLLQISDEEGLKWVVQQVTGHRATREGIITEPAVNVICLDDSALRKQVFLQSDATYDEAKAWAAFSIDEELVKLVKSELLEYDPKQSS